VDDGRSFVQRSEETWGVITLEPLMPYTPAAIHLYTEDFYRECAPRLAPGGVMCQWIPLQGMSGDDFKRLVAAFVAVFPDSACFFVDGAVALIGGNEPFAMPYARVAGRLSGAVAKDDLADVGFDDPVRALATFVAGGEALRKFAESVPPVTDEFPVLEFHPIPPRVLLKHLWENLRAMRDLRGAYERLPVDLAGVADPDVEARLFLTLRAGKHLLDGQVSMEESGLLVRMGDRANGLAAAAAARDSFRLAVSVDPENVGARRASESVDREWETGLGADALSRNDFPAAERHFRRALEFRAARQADVAWTRLAETLSRAEKFEDALAAATEATRLFPRGADALAERAYARAALHDMDGAASDYRRALAGGGLDELASPRLRQDAERVLANVPDAQSAVDLDARIESALRGVSVARIPASHLLAICAADDRARFASHFAGDLAVAASRTAPPADRLAAMQRLASAMPEGSAVIAMRVLAEPAAETALLEAAATVVVRRDPVWLRDVMLTELPQRGMAAAAFAAGRTGRLMFVDVLLPLLLDDAAGVRRAAQVALFSLVGDKAPGLGRLDLAAYPSAAYRTAVQDLRAWWVRERDRVESGR
jgi:tetratricopeptide (TPR) repeat protein